MWTRKQVLWGIGLSWLVAACGGPLGDPPQSCSAIEGSVFESVDNHEVGLGPNGPAMGKWSVTFKTDGNYQWNHSDVQESGRYFCNGLGVEGTRGDGTFYEGSFSSDGSTLTWEGVDYAFATTTDD
jgi:hypothetical protein